MTVAADRTAQPRPIDRAAPASPSAAQGEAPSTLRTVVAPTVAFLLVTLLYLTLVPPFESPDENSHYEVARLYADLGRPPRSEDRAAGPRAEIASYMTEHGYGLMLPVPGSNQPELGFNSELERQPPGYYALAALLLRMAPIDLEGSLRVGRLVSALLGAVTVAAAALAARALFPDDPFARSATPLLIVALPGFAFMSASLNNDAAANAAGALVFLGLALGLRGRQSLTPAIALTIAALALGLAGKRTALAAAPLALVGSYWVLLYRWRWPVAPRVALAVLPVAALLLAPKWAIEDAPGALGWRAVQLSGGQRVEEGLFGDAAFRAAGGRVEQALSDAEIASSGGAMTVVAWARSEGPGGATARLELNTGTRQASVDLPVADAWRPLRVELSGAASAPIVALGAIDGVVLFDGVTAATGIRPGLPEPSTPDGRAGRWAGQSYQNALRNGSAELAEPRLAEWVVPMAERVGATPALVVAGLHPERIGRLAPEVLRFRIYFAYQGLVGRFGWLVLPMPDLAYQAVAIVAGLAVPGLALLALRAAATQTAIDRRRLVVAALCALGVIGTAAVGLLPFLTGVLGDEWPQGRYLYPGLVPAAALVALGLSQLIPRRLTQAALVLTGIVGIGLHALALLGTIVPRYSV